MGARSAAVVQKKKFDFDSLFVPPERIHHEMRRVFDQIARRAYESLKIAAVFLARIRTIGTEPSQPSLNLSAMKRPTRGRLRSGTRRFIDGTE
jgi:hypothetical protein